MSDVTQILNRIQHGELKAASELLPLVYEELRKLAALKMSQEKPGQTLDATALVHEAYLRLVGPLEERSFADRGEFFAAAATAMHRILIESARRKQRIKRGGRMQRAPLDLDGLAADSPGEDLLDLHDALEELAASEPLKAKLVELRYFTGMTLPKAAECLGISSSTADRAWRYARAWLYAAMDGKQKTDST
jgi:RNA polymerase sigma factor (TIGR02999 family)